MFKLGEIAFGDNVQIKNAEATRQSGHADLLGICYGMTTPSATGAEIIGDTDHDVALNVHFVSDAIADAWFAPELVVLVDHVEGSQATVGDRSFVKTADGEWVPEQPNDRTAKVVWRRWFRRR